MVMPKKSMIKVKSVKAASTPSVGSSRAEELEPPARPSGRDFGGRPGDKARLIQGKTLIQRKTTTSR